MSGPWGRAAGYRVMPRDVASIRAIAQSARRVLEITDPRISMIELLEIKLHRMGIHFHVVDDDEIPGEAARAVPDRGRILITDSAYHGIHRNDPKHELLVPHELGHIVLEHATTFAFSNPRAAHPANADSEVQADYFSHEFALPVAGIQRWCQSIVQIQDVFNVPRDDAVIRADMLRREGLIGW